MSNNRRGRRRSEIRRNQRGETYAQILVEVLESPAFRAMPDYAARVLLLVAAQYRGANNGDLSVTSNIAADNEISEWKLRAGLYLLDYCGLLELMRQGHISVGKGVCSLYALGWREIDPSDKYDQPVLTRRSPPNRWATWVRPDDWEQIKKRRRLAAQGNRNRRPWNELAAHPTRVSHPNPPECSEQPAVEPHNGPVRPIRVSRKAHDPTTRGCGPSESLAEGMSNETFLASPRKSTAVH